MILIGILINEYQDPHKSSRRRHRPVVQPDTIDLALIWVIKVCLVVIYLTVPQLVVDATEPTIQPDEAFFFMCSGGHVTQLHDELLQHPGTCRDIATVYKKIGYSEGQVLVVEQRLCS